LHSIGTTPMWARAQTLPPHCEGSGSETTTNYTHISDITSGDVKLNCANDHDDYEPFASCLYRYW